MPLITLSDITAKKDVSTHLGDVATQLIDDAELVDLRPLLGERMYYDVLANVAEAGYAVLVNGGDYTYDGITMKCPGLKRVLVEFAYARISFFGNEKSTPFGLVEKRYQDGQMVHRDRGKERYKAAQQVAMQLWWDVKAYLDRNSSEFAEWTCGESTRGMLSGFKFRHIR